MLYRAIIGFVPMVLIALFATGAIPLSSVMPATEYRSSAVQGDDEKRPGQLGPVRNGKEAVAEKIGELYGVRPDQASLMQEEFRELESEIQRVEQERAFEKRSPGWKPKSGGGWGSQD